MKFVRHVFLLAVAGCLLAQPVAAAEGIKGNLVTVDWLEKNLKKSDVLVLDASATQNYTASHIPGAISVSFAKGDSTSLGANLSYGGGVDLFTDMTNCPYAFQELPVADMEKLYQSWGINSGSKVVVYDQGGAFLATRLFYSLYYHGFPTRNLFILDGGLAKWQEEGMPVTKEVTPSPKKGNFKIKKVNDDIKVKLPEFITAGGDRENNALVEGLPPVWHFGEALNYNKRGHIPFAIMLSFTDFFKADKTYKSPEEIQRMLTYLGIRPEQTVYTH